jgi:hypothetical protein
MLKLHIEGLYSDTLPPKLTKHNFFKEAEFTLHIKHFEEILRYG